MIIFAEMDSYFLFLRDSNARSRLVFSFFHRMKFDILLEPDAAFSKSELEFDMNRIKVNKIVENRLKC